MNFLEYYRSHKRLTIAAAAAFAVILLAVAAMFWNGPSFKQGNFLVERRWGRSKLPGRIEVELVMLNLPATSFGKLDVRGTGIIDADGREYNWKDFPVRTKISGRCAKLRFWQRIPHMNFKVFQAGGWEEVLVDPYDGSGNILLNLSRVADMGNRVRITVDCSVNRVPAPPSDISPNFTLNKIPGAASSKPGLIEVELVMSHFNPALNGTRVTARGADMINQEGQREHWAGDDITAEVKNGAATVVFWQERPVTDFKVFQCETPNEVLGDKASRDGNMRFHIGRVAKPGDKVRITANCGT